MTRAIPSRISTSVEADNAKTIRDEWHRTAQRVFSEMEARRERDSRRAFWIVLAILAALLCATAAGADTVKTWGHNTASHVELHEPTAPGAVASITFHDALVHASSEAFTLTLDGLPVTFQIEHMGADPGERLHITVPEGYVVWPDVLQPGENDTGTAHVYPPGVGM